MFADLHFLYYYRDTSAGCFHTCSKCLLLLASCYGKDKVSPGNAPSAWCRKDNMCGSVHP